MLADTPPFSPRKSEVLYEQYGCGKPLDGVEVGTLLSILVAQRTQVGGTRSHMSTARALASRSMLISATFRSPRSAELT